MSSLNFKLNVKTTDDFLTKNIKKELVGQLTRATNKMQSSLLIEFQNVVRLRLTNSETYESLVNGELKDIFILKDAQSALDHIINQVLASIQVIFNNFRLSTNGYTGGITIRLTIPKFDLTPILEATLLTFQGSEVDWLKLLINDNVAFFEHDAIKNAKGETVITSKIPVQHRGSPNKNWITRALIGVEKDIQDIIEKGLN